MKQNVMKRTLAGVLAVLTVAAYMPANVGGFLTESTGIVMGVSAEGEAQVSDAAGLAAAINNGAVKLTGDVSLSDTLEITADTTIDLNGHNITATGFRAFHVKSGTLTLSGTGGTIASNGLTDDSKSVIRVGDNGYSGEANLIIGENVIVSSDSCYGVSVFGNKTTETVSIFGTVAVTGTANAISGNGSTGYGGTTININPGAVVSAANDVAIYHPQAGTLNITGGTITGLGGVVARAGNINVSGGTFTCTGTEAGKVGDYETLIPRSALVFDEVANYPGLTDDAKISVTGGSFTTASGVDAVTTINNVSRISITGGTFNTDVSAYVAEGYAQNPDGTVVAQADSEWVLNESKTYTLNKNTTVGKITVAPGVKATLDLCGYDLNLALESGDAGNRSFLVGEGAELTIKNTYIGTGGVITANSQSTVDKNAKLYISSGVTLTQNKAEYTIYYKAGSTVTVHGTVENRYEKGEAAISGNHNNSAGSTLNIMNGAVLTEKGNAIYHPQDGTLNITGGTVSGETAIYARTGNINISGGTVKGTKATYVAPDTYPDGADPTGDAIVCQSHESYGVPVLKITDGIIESKSGKTVASYAYNQKTPAISITGGRFLNPTNYPGIDELDRSFIAAGYAQYKFDFGSGSNVVKLSTLDETQYFTVTNIDINKNKTPVKVYPNYFGVDTYTVPKIGYYDGMDFQSYAFYDKDGNFLTDVASTESAGQAKANELVAQGQSFTVEMRYYALTGGGTLTVDGGYITSLPRTPDGYPISDYISRNDLVKVTATDTAAFSYWVKIEGNKETIVSYNSTYSFYMPEGDVKLKAVFNQEVAEPQATANIESVTPNSSTSKVSFVSVINVPQKAKFVKGGLVATSDATIGKNVTADNAAYVKLSTAATSNTKNLKYTWTKTKVTTETIWYVKSYVVYKDSKGVEHTVYSDAVKANINGVIQ